MANLLAKTLNPTKPTDQISDFCANATKTLVRTVVIKNLRKRMYCTCNCCCHYQLVELPFHFEDTSIGFLLMNPAAKTVLFPSPLPKHSIVQYVVGLWKRVGGSWRSVVRQSVCHSVDSATCIWNPNTVTACSPG
jgi:hypothetical protein